MNEQIYVIVLCPCCASAQDAKPHRQLQEFVCVACGQSWAMVVDADRHTEHSLH
jgi:hypothetical protein